MKIRPVPVLVGAVLFTAVGALMPAASDAATWWPWSKRQERTEQRPELGGDGIVIAQADVAERLNHAEARIRELTGQVEELNYRLRQIQNQLGLQDSGPGATGGIAVMSNDVGGAGGPPQELGSLNIDLPSDQPIDLATPADGMAPAGAELRGSTEIVSLGVPAADYDQAYSAILAGDYALAEAAFRNFLVAYPSDGRVPDARYWLGESLFARGQYSDAADEFLAGYKTDPKSGKAPDTLLKLGLSLAGLGEREAACSTYGEVLRKYPDASKALSQRVKAEQAVAGC